MTNTQTTKISLVMAIIIGVNAMIGAGIFSIPSELMQAVGPAGLLSMILVSMGVWFMAKAFAQLAHYYPQEGSFYTYTAAWAGHRAGTIATLLYLLGMTVAMGLLSTICGLYLHKIIPAISPSFAGYIILGAITFITVLGVRVSSVGQYIMIVCTLFPLMAITLLCLAKANVQNLLPFMPYGFGSVVKASRLVVFSFFGFECAASLFAIMKNPEKAIGKAFVYSIAIVACIYLVFVGSIMSAVAPLLVSGQTTLTEPLQQLYPQLTAFFTLIDISIMSAILGTIHAMLWSASYLFSFLIERLFGTKNAWILQPQHNALLLGTAICIPLTFISSIGLFFYITAALVVCAYLLCIAGLLIKKQQRSYTALIGCLVAGIIFFFALEGIFACL